MVRDGMGGFNRWGFISYLSVDYGWSVSQKMVVAISNLFYLVFGPLLGPIPNFIQIGEKTQKLKTFAVGQFWLFGLVGRKIIVSISNSFCLVFAPFLAPMPNFIQIGQKTQKLKIFTFG